MSNPESSRAVMGRPVTEDDLTALEQFRDEHGHAVSFYFKPGEGPRSQRDGMLVNLRAHDIISNDFLREDKSHGLLRDLDAVLEISEGVEQTAPMKVVFACHDQGVWQEFNVPASARLIRLEAGKKFEIGPLLRLLHKDDSSSTDA